MHSLGLGRYTFEFLGPVAKNGTIVGVASEAVIGSKHSDTNMDVMVTLTGLRMHYA